MLGSGSSLGRGIGTLPPDMPPLPQCLLLDPITLGNQKYTRSGEMRRVLGVPLGSTSEEHSFGVSHQKMSPPVATEELKHFKDSVQDASRKARDRVKKFRESIFILDKYREALSSKKQQCSEISPMERTGGANIAKIGSQMNRTSRDVTNQRLEERTKSVGLIKRVRTSLADLQADGRPTGTSRQSMVTEKDGDMLPAVSGANVRIEEKILRLPVGGEGWDKKMKRKRSIATVGGRIMNTDRDIKRSMQPKLSADSKLRSCDAQSFRSKSSPGDSGINKLDGSYEHASSDAGMVLRNELDNPPPPRDCAAPLEQGVLAKGNNNRPKILEDNPGSGPSTMLKGKASRAPRTGSIMVLDSSSKVHPSSEAFQDCQLPSSRNKVPMSGVANNQKRPTSAGSPAHAMAQWVGQRPHKNSRARRTNLVSPVSNSEAQVVSQSFSTPDLSARAPFGTNGSLLASGLGNNSPKIKREFENISSPFGLSESEESGGGETKLKEKGIGSGDGVTHKVGSFMLPARKNKMLTNEVGDGVRRQGRSGNFSSSTRPSIHPKREKLENLPTTRPLQSMRPASDKNKSKSGRPPSKKVKDRKASIRVGQMLNSVASDFTGESDDDNEELFAAANSARNASNLACSGAFWKKMESIFASPCSEDMSYLKQQLSFAEELKESLSQMFGHECNLMGVLVQKEVPDNCDGQESHLNQEKANSDALHGRFGMGKPSKVSPLYQRVLSALIEEDDSDEFHLHSEGKSLSLHYASDDSHCGSCNLMDIEPKDRDRVESEAESKVDFQSQKSCLLDRLSCDKSTASNTFRNPSTSSSLHSNGRWLGDDDFSHSDFGLVSEICSNDLVQQQPKETNVPGFSSSDCQYQLMCLDDKLLLELNSIGLYPETLPGLAEGEDVINQDIQELKGGLYQQVGRKKNKLSKIDKAIQKARDVERRNREHCAMNQLIEKAYSKRMACHGSHASKSAVRKVSRQVALAFIKRALARCRKFEETGSSCFSEPTLQDVLLSAPPCGNNAKSADCVGSGTASNTCNEASNNQTEARGSGAVSSTFERYDTQSDNLDGSSSDAFPKHRIMLNKRKREVLIDDVVGSASSRVTSTFDNTNLGGARGKRSERENKISKSMSVSAAGGSSLGGFKSERRTKAKYKNKNNCSSTSGNTIHGGNPPAVNPSNKKWRDVGSSLPGNICVESSKEADELANLELQELDDDLGGNWFNGLQDHDSMGLEIPMDELSDLNMLL